MGFKLKDDTDMRPETRSELKNVLLSFVSSIVEVPYSVEELKKAYPFHALIFPGEAIKSFKNREVL